MRTELVGTNEADCLNSGFNLVATSIEYLGRLPEERRVDGLLSTDNEHNAATRCRLVVRCLTASYHAIKVSAAWQNENLQSNGSLLLIAVQIGIVNTPYLVNISRWRSKLGMLSLFYSGNETNSASIKCQTWCGHFKWQILLFRFISRFSVPFSSVSITRMVLTRRDARSLGHATSTCDAMVQ